MNSVLRREDRPPRGSEDFMVQSTVATLRIASPNEPERLVYLQSGNSVVIGRDSGCSIPLADPGLSREHAELSCSSYGVVIADLGSLNGTFVNGEKLVAMRDLAHGDILDLGAVRISIELQEDIEDHVIERSPTLRMTRYGVSVLVATVHNLQDFAQMVSIEQAEACLAVWRRRIDNVVAAHQGLVDKVIRGTTVAVWREVDERLASQHAFAAGCELVKASKTLRSDLEEYAPGCPDWQCGFTIGSGIAISQGAGRGVAQTQRMIGDPINTALTIDEQGRQYEADLICDDETAKLLQGFTELVDLGAVSVPGIRTPVPLFAVGVPGVSH